MTLRGGHRHGLVTMEDLWVSIGVSLGTGLPLDRGGGGDTSGRKASEAQEDVQLHSEMEVERRETKTVVKVVRR